MENETFFHKENFVFWWGLRPRPWAGPDNDIFVSLVFSIKTYKIQIIYHSNPNNLCINFIFY